MTSSINYLFAKYDRDGKGHLSPDDFARFVMELSSKWAQVDARARESTQPQDGNGPHSNVPPAGLLQEHIALAGHCKSTDQPCKRCSRGAGCRWANTGRLGHRNTRQEPVVLVGACKSTGQPCKRCSTDNKCRWANTGRLGHNNVIKAPRLVGVCKSTGQPCKGCLKGQEDKGCRWANRGLPGHISSLAS